ncbi:MAG: class II aldolase/adducin family protein [Chthonomonas sp.]|nr:class II aldolase/adducin family protein [Chthonomonas sp.]
MPEQKLRELMCEVGQRMLGAHLVCATEGNLSARMPDGRLLCTPRGVSKGHLKPEDLVVVDLAGTPFGPGTPSSEILLHLEVYRQREDCMAVVHAHPPHATAFAVAGETIPDHLTPEASAVLGSVPLAPFGFPGTTAVPQSISRLIVDHKAILLSHHGAVTLGRDLLDAYYRMETLEATARLAWLTRALGGPSPLPADATERLRSEFGNGQL